MNVIEHGKLDAEKAVVAVAATTAAGQPEPELAQVQRQQPLSKSIFLAAILASSSFLNVSNRIIDILQCASSH